jgi:hypothetical protein
MTKRLFYLSAAILCLALAYHLGSRNAFSAPQSGQLTNPAVAVDAPNNDPSVLVALTAIGDVFQTTNGGTTWRFVGNIHGNPTPTAP